MELYQQIRKLRLAGNSQRQIAKQLHISRNTVRKYWDGDSVPWERKEYERTATILTDEVKAFIENCIHEDEKEHLKKQQHTARRIYNRLVDELNFTGGESTIRRYVQQVRMQTPEVFIPLSFSPGDAVQIDWGEVTIYLQQVKTPVYIFCARLCYSGAPFVRAYRRQNSESFLDALVRMLEYYGGTPRKVIFDNAKIAVKDGFGAHARSQDTYAALAAHYGFEAIFCNPASGNEKGLVEGLVGFIRRNVCVPVPKVEDLEELNKTLYEKCQQYSSHHIYGKDAPVGEMLQFEQKHLYPLPAYKYDVAKKTHARVDRFSTVRFDTNNYSVPANYCGKEVTIKALPEKVQILSKNNMIAEHNRCLAHKQCIYTLEHYLPILEQKGRAIFYAKPVKDNIPPYFLEWLSRQEFTPKQLTQILYRCKEEGFETIMNRSIISVQEPLIQDTVTVQAVDLSRYDALYVGKVGVN